MQQRKNRLLNELSFKLQESKLIQQNLENDLELNQSTIQKIKNELAASKEKQAISPRLLSEKIQTFKSKNTFLRSIYEKLNSIDLQNKTDQRKMNTVLKLIEVEMYNKGEWTTYLKQFKHRHPYLYRKIRQNHSNLSFNDWRLIALTAYGLSTNEIASTLNISIDGVKKARYRLRKKLEIPATKDFRDYINSL